eukprot:6207305-Pleurochrysis_carterae.AAC.3
MPFPRAKRRSSPLRKPRRRALTYARSSLTLAWPQPSQRSLVRVLPDCSYGDITIRRPLALLYASHDNLFASIGYPLLDDVYRIITRLVMCMLQVCLSGMYMVVYIHSGFITPSPTHAATLECMHATARRPRPAVAERSRRDRGTRYHQL